MLSYCTKEKRSAAQRKRKAEMKTLEDYQIVDMYWAREESAISETDAKYGRMLSNISLAIVKTDEDAGECLNDTYLAAWKPPRLSRRLPF